jgi:hypothetical protein
MLRIGANFSSALRWALMVELSKPKQYTRNKKRFWLIATIQIGLPVPSFAQMLAVLSLELFVAPKNSRMPMSARICHVCIVHSYTIPLHRFLICCRALQGQCSLCTQNDPPLLPIPLTIPLSICLMQSNCAFFPSWMCSSLVYNFNGRLFLQLEHATWHISTHTAFFAFCRQLSILHGRYNGVHLTQSGNKHK